MAAPNPPPKAYGSVTKRVYHAYLPLFYIIFCLFSYTMAAPTSPVKTFKVKDGYTYGYIHEKAQESKPTFLLLHGFPSSRFDYHNQIADLSKAGYGVIALDLLGYGDTDKPTSFEEYKLSKMSHQVAEVLDHEGLTKVIGVGHDWGSGFLSALSTFHPNYFTSLVFISVPYSPGAFELDDINKRAEAAFGYTTFGYMYFFNDTISAPIVDSHLESFLSLVYPQQPELWRSDFCPVGNAQKWIEGGKLDPLPIWESSQDRDYRIQLFKKGGFTGPLNWYKAGIRKIETETPESIVLNVPVLFIGGDRDYACRIETMQQVATLGKQQGWLPNVEVKVVEGASHWVLMEKPEEIFCFLDEVAKSLE